MTVIVSYEEEARRGQFTIEPLKESHWFGLFNARACIRCLPLMSWPLLILELQMPLLGKSFSYILCAFRLNKCALPMCSNACKNKLSVNVSTDAQKLQRWLFQITLLAICCTKFTSLCVTWGLIHSFDGRFTSSFKMESHSLSQLWTLRWPVVDTIRS